jgi:hypothetical protein
MYLIVEALIFFLGLPVLWAEFHVFLDICLFVDLSWVVWYVRWHA